MDVGRDCAAALVPRWPPPISPVTCATKWSAQPLKKIALDCAAKSLLVWIPGVDVWLVWGFGMHTVAASAAALQVAKWRPAVSPGTCGWKNHSGHSKNSQSLSKKQLSCSCSDESQVEERNLLPVIQLSLPILALASAASIPVLFTSGVSTSRRAHKLIRGWVTCCTWPITALPIVGMAAMAS